MQKPILIVLVKLNWQNKLLLLFLLEKLGVLFCQVGSQQASLSAVIMQSYAYAIWST